MVGSMGLETWRTDALSRLLLDAAGVLRGELDDDVPAQLGDEFLARLSVRGEQDGRNLRRTQTFTLYMNGAPTGLSVTVANNASTGSATVSPRHNQSGLRDGRVAVEQPDDRSTNPSVTVG
jgi:hypothetical protein